MKRMGWTTMVALAAAVTLGCDTTSRNQAAVESEQREAVGTSGIAEGDDKQFVEKMGAAGMAEVRLGMLAKERATNPGVKQFAEMMMRDHTIAGTQLKQIANRHGIAMPSQLSEEHQKTMAHLSKLTGEHFDRSYMRAMVEGHEDVVDLLQTRAEEDRFGDDKGSVEPKDADNPVDMTLNQWAAATLATARTHLDEAKRIHLALENVFGPPAGVQDTTPQSSSRRGH